MLWGQMIPAQIEKEILIEAPIHVVWRIVTEPDQIKQWFCPDAELDSRTGGAGRMAFEHGYTYFLEVVAVEPPSRFAYRWLRDQGIERLQRLNVRYKIDWTDEAKVKYIEENSSGWRYYLGRLRDYARRSNTAARG